MPFKFRNLLLVAALLAAPAAQAQWSGKAELGMLLSDGNTESKSANTKFDLKHEGPKWTNNLYASALYGENAEFAKACAAAGLTFVGPTPETLDLFGNKATARALAQKCDVPILSGTSKATSLAEATAFFDKSPDGIMIKAISGACGSRTGRRSRSAGSERERSASGWPRRSPTGSCGSLRRGRAMLCSSSPPVRATWGSRLRLCWVRADG